VKQWPIWAAIFLDLCGFSALIVDIQFRAGDMGAPGWKIGLILASTFVVQVLASPYWGRLSDRIGRKKVFLITSLLSAASMAIYAVAPNPWILLLSRLIAGGGAANTAIAQAAVADASPGDLLAPAMGKMQAAQNLGLILGPSLGGWIAWSFGSAAVGWGACVASCVGAFVAVAFAEMKPGSFENRQRSYAFGAIIKDFPAIAPYFFASAAAWFSLATLEGTFGRLIEHNLGLGTKEFGIIFAFESAVGIGVSVFLLGLLISLKRDRLILALSYLVMGSGLALTPFAPSLPWLFLASLFFAAGQGVASPAISSLCSREVAEDRQGELFGLMQGARSIGFILGPILGGVLFDWKPGSPYFLAGGICVAAAIIVLSVRSKASPAASG
jgi:MFS transporter, DHA1 family, multidrug resistance protein